MINRRDFIKLSAVGGGAVIISGTGGLSMAQMAPKGSYAGQNEFYFVQLSDTHWGYQGPNNPESSNTLRKAVMTVNALESQPDFVMFTGDLTHTTDDPKERRKRLAEFRDIVSGLKVKDVRFIPGEHDASLDAGEAFREFFGKSHYSFDHKGVHFVALDNVSDPGANIGNTQLDWLSDDLAKQAKGTRIVVFTHRPLFDLAPKWDWATRDGAKAVDILLQYPDVTVFYGHIHQENHFQTGHISHHSAKSLVFALPTPGSQEKRTPIAWNPDQPFAGLGFREIENDPKSKTLAVTEFPVTRG